MPLKIALYHNLSSGGAKRTIFDIVRRLASQCQIDLYCPATADLKYCDISGYTRETVVFPYRLSRTFGSPFGRANSLVRLRNLVSLEFVQRQVASEIDRAGYDAVLVEPCMVSQAPSILRYLRTPSVYVCHEPPRGLYEPVIQRPYQQSSWRRRALDRVDVPAALYRTILQGVDRKNTRSAKTVLVDSKYVARNVRQIYGIKARVCHPGVDTGMFHPQDTGRENFVVSTGALKPEKGFDLVIQSLAVVPLPLRPRLVVVSNWEISAEREYLSSLAKRCDVDVTFKVDISDAELVSLYNHASFTVYAPVREPLGLVPLESQACTTPVVGVAEGGVLETVLDQQTGLLVKRDPVYFGEAIARLMSDTRLLAEFGRRGRIHVQESWNWDSSIGVLLDALDQAADGRRYP